MTRLITCLLAALAASFGLAQTPTLQAPPDWGAREVYLADLTPEAASDLAKLADAPEYRLRLEISDDWRTVSGALSLRFVHRGDELLEDVVLRLLPNALGSRMTVAGVSVDGERVTGALEQSDTALRLPLSVPRLPGEAVTVALEFELSVGDGATVAYGRMGRYQRVLSLPSPYPVLSVYRDGVWLSDLPHDQGDPLVAEAAFYLADVSLSAAHDLVASGRILTREVQGERQMLRLAAGPARELYLALAEGYALQSLATGETVLHSYAPAALAEPAQQGLEVAAQALSLFGELFAPYPYRELEFVAVPIRAGGIEYPGVINLAESLYTDPRHFVSVVVHEVAHQWSYNLVGSDQVLEPWLDEALAQYLTYLYHERYSGDAFTEGYLEQWRRIWQNSPDPEQALGEPVTNYPGGGYSGVVYGRGLFFYLDLEERLGREMVLGILREYYTRHAWDFVTSADLEAVAEEVCRCDLSEAFGGWVYPNED